MKTIILNNELESEQSAEKKIYIKPILVDLEIEKTSGKGDDLTEAGLGSFS